MFDIYEQPWTLLGIAVIVLFVVLTYRSVIPEKRKWWQWLIPLLITAAAFGIDTLVKTDNEKIEAVLNAGMKAVEVENFNAIDSYLSDNYSDSIHASKEQLIEHAQHRLDMNVVEKCQKTGQKITFSQNKAKANLFMQIVLSKDSPITQTFSIPFFNLKVDVDFIKQNNDWLIDCIEIRSVNQQQARWSDIR